jgi:hypothetical protein
VGGVRGKDREEAEIKRGCAKKMFRPKQRSSGITYFADSGIMVLYVYISRINSTQSEYYRSCLFQILILQQLESKNQEFKPKQRGTNIIDSAVVAGGAIGVHRKSLLFVLVKSHNLVFSGLAILAVVNKAN